MSFLKRKRRKNRFKKAKEETQKMETVNEVSREDGGLMTGEVELTLHEQNSSMNHSVLLSTEEFGGLQEGVIIEITYDLEIEKKGKIKKKSNNMFCFPFKRKYLTDYLNSRQAKMSFEAKYCDTKKLEFFLLKGKKVKWRALNLTEQHERKIAVIEIGFKNQYISLRDLKEISTDLSHRFVSIDEEINIDGFDIKVTAMRNLKSQPVKFGLICPKYSQINYYSLSSKVLITLQICQEMFEFSNNRDLTFSSYMEFLQGYFQNLKRSDCNHSIVIVLHARVYFKGFKNRNILFLEAFKNKIEYSDMNTFLHEKNGDCFKDFYYTINVSNKHRIETTIQRIKIEIIKFVKNLPLKDNPIDNISYEKTEETEFQINQQHKFKGELCTSMTSNLLEAVSLFIENTDISQAHNSLKSTGIKVISLVAKSTKFFVEEYFVRFLKLKLFINDAIMMIISFCDSTKIKTPSFLALDDEDLLGIHRHGIFKKRDANVECNQFMIKLRKKGARLAPTLNGCITRHKMLHEKISNGRYFSKQMAKDIIDKFNLKMSEMEYFSLVKSFFGYIDIDEIEDNLKEISNDDIFKKFPEYADTLKIIFDECGHVTHRVITSNNNFERQDYDRFLRFFEDKNLFRCFKYEEISHLNIINNNTEKRLLESVKGKIEPNIELNKTYFETMMGNLKEKFLENSGQSPIRNRRKSSSRKINFFSPVKFDENIPSSLPEKNEISLHREKSKSSFIEEAPLMVQVNKSKFQKIQKEFKYQYSLRKSNQIRDSDFLLHTVDEPFSPKQKITLRASDAIYRTRWEKFEKSQKFSKIPFCTVIALTKIPPLQYDPSYLKFEKQKKYSQNSHSLNTTGFDIEQILEVLSNLRLIHGFQFSDIKLFRNQKIKFCKGHLIHTIKNNFGNIQIEKKHRIKTAQIYNKKHEVSKNDINYFFYSYSVWSKSCNQFLNGNKIFFNRDTFDWENLDSSIIKSMTSKNLTPEKLFTHSVKKDAFCISLVIYDEKPMNDKDEVNPKLEEFIENLNKNLIELTGEDLDLKLGGCNRLISNEKIAKISDEKREKKFVKEYLNMEIYDGDYFNSLIIELFWLTPNSFVLHAVRFSILSTAVKCKLNYSILKCSLNKLFENITLEPCYILKGLNEVEIFTKIDKLKDIGFYEVSVKRGEDLDVEPPTMKGFHFRSYSAGVNFMGNDIEDIGKVGEGGEGNKDIVGYMLHPEAFIWVIVRKEGMDFVEFFSGNFCFKGVSGCNVDLSEVIKN